MDSKEKDSFLSLSPRKARMLINVGLVKGGSLKAKTLMMMVMVVVTVMFMIMKRTVVRL